MQFSTRRPNKQTNRQTNKPLIEPHYSWPIKRATLVATDNHFAPTKLDETNQILRLFFPHTFSQPTGHASSQQSSIFPPIFSPTLASSCRQSLAPASPKSSWPDTCHQLSGAPPLFPADKPFFLPLLSNSSCLFPNTKLKSVCSCLPLPFFSGCTSPHAFQLQPEPVSHRGQRQPVGSQAKAAKVNQLPRLFRKKFATRMQFASVSGPHTVT